jgi:hypothetical protein
MRIDEYFFHVLLSILSLCGELDPSIAVLFGNEYFASIHNACACQLNSLSFQTHAGQVQNLLPV